MTRARWGYMVVEAGVGGVDQIHDVAQAVGCNMMRALCGGTRNPASVQLPRDVEPWRRFYRAPVAFERPRSVMRFERRWLATPVATADRALHSLLRRHADAARERPATDAVSEVRRVVHGSIAEGCGHAAQVAGLLGVHVRTLSRRLAAAGTTVQRLRDEVLHEMSLQLLGATSMPVAAVADALGYADATVFTRAFRRWSGRTPAPRRRETVGGRGADAPS